jgi:hypothetical protein
LQKVSQPEAAKLLKVSPRSVADAKKIRQHGTAELVRRVERGEVSVSLAAKVTKMPEEQQAKVVGLDQCALRGAVKAALGEPKIALPATKQPISDRLLWGEQQADLLRRLAAGERVHDQVEWLNIAEAVEAPGRDLRCELASRISTVLRCLLQLGLATREHRRQRAWRDTVDRELQVIEPLLANVPSLQPTIPAVIKAELAGAKAAALKALDARKSNCSLFEDGFPKRLQKQQFEDPYEIEMRVSWAIHKIELWASKVCLPETRTAGAFGIDQSSKVIVDGEKVHLTDQLGLRCMRNGTGRQPDEGRGGWGGPLLKAEATLDLRSPPGWSHLSPQSDCPIGP